MNSSESSTQRQDDPQRAKTVSLLTDLLREAMTSLREDNNFSEVDLYAKKRIINDAPASTTEERLQTEAIVHLQAFKESCRSLDDVLLRLANDAHQLGSSVRVVLAAQCMRQELRELNNTLCRHVKPLITSTRGALHKDIDFGSQGLGEDVPKQLLRFADVIDKLVICLSEFPKFEDVSDRKPLYTLKIDLQYWASRTDVHHKSINRMEVRTYLLSIMSEMSSEMTSVSTALASFTTSGIPALLSLQEYKIENKLNLIQIATFLSSVTATCIGFSFQNNDTAVATAVNGFWFTSLALSTLIIINLLLGVSWYRSVYRAAADRVPFLVRFWLNLSPPTFLALSVLNFSAGFVLFSWSSSQHSSVITITVVLTAIMLLGFIGAFIWLCYERKVSKATKSSDKTTRSLTNAFSGLWHRATTSLPLYISDISISVRSLNATLASFSTQELPGTSRSGSFLEKSQTVAQESDTSGKFQLARRLLSIPMSCMQNMRRLLTTAIGTQREMSVRMLTQRLKTIKMSHEEPDGHTGVINHLQFSPDGSRLVTTGHDQRSMLYTLEDGKLTFWRTMVHIDGEIRQLDWSPSGDFFLARSSSSIEIWTKDGVLHRSFPRRNSRAVSWIPMGGTHGTPSPRVEFFLSVEGDKVVRMHRDIGYRTEYLIDPPTGKLAIEDIEVMNDGRRFIGIGMLTATQDQLKPIKGKIEKQIVVFNMDTSVVEWFVKFILLP